MPSAKIHEAIAIKMNSKLKMDDILLRIGSVAPDSWRNVENPLVSKSKYLTHFWDYRSHDLQSNNYQEFYLKYYDDIKNPFYFGYFLHLITDQYWKINIDTLYEKKINDKKYYKLLDGTLKEDKDYFSYYESLKIQQELSKEYNLGILPTKRKDINNFKCEIDEFDPSGLFGDTGTIAYINSKVPNGDNIEKSVIYDIDKIKQHINKTIDFIEKEIKRLENLQKEYSKKIKIAIDIDDTILNTSEKEKEYWPEFQKKHKEINSNLNYKNNKEINDIFWDEYREKIAFGKVFDGVQECLNKLNELGYVVDLVSSRPLDKYESIRKKMIDYFSNLNLKYNYLNLGFKSKIEFLIKHKYNILIDNDINIIKEAQKNNINTILFNNISSNYYNGIKTNDWNKILEIINNYYK